MLLGNWKARRAEGFADRPIGIEINLPVMIRVTIRPHRQDRAGEIEVENFHVGRRIRLDIGYRCQSFFQQQDGFVVIDGVVQLGQAIDAPVRVHREVLNRI